MEIVSQPGAYPENVLAPGSASVSAVSWAAIAAGAVVAAATSLLLMALGGGIGLAAVSPWDRAAAAAAKFAATTAIALIVIQWLSAAVGGYIAGRMRTRWVSLHTHEVFFRDTAHGFITWATATLVVTAAAAVIAGSALGKGTDAASAVASRAGPMRAGYGSVDPYDVDTLLRSTQPAAVTPNADVRPQATRILERVVATGTVSADDRSYLAGVVATQTGLAPTDAQTRVDAAIANAQATRERMQQAADSARKAAEATSIFTALSMLIGAFIASISAALGGRLRDLHP